MQHPGLYEEPFPPTSSIGEGGSPGKTLGCHDYLPSVYTGGEICQVEPPHYLGVYLHDEAMRHFSLYEEIQSYLDVGHIRRLFEIQGQGHMEPTLVFLCMVRVVVDDLPNEMPEYITFKAAGMSISITMRQFYTAMGLYEEHEMEDLTYERFIYALGSFPYSLLWCQ